MYYITKAGLEFLNETKARKPKATTNRQVINRASVEALGDTLQPNPGNRSTAKEEDILALQARMDAKAALDKKMGREVT
tara:strand:- start:155 stop:391 length:237 start_codon:yes stop_codon:yes gene_type:complete